MITRLAYSVDEAAEALGLSANTVWTMLSDGVLGRVKVGRRTLVPVSAIEEFLLENRTGRPEDRPDSATRPPGDDR